jgi:hypothetical protein
LTLLSHFETRLRQRAARKKIREFIASHPEYA